MANTRPTLVGVFNDSAVADQAINALQRDGFRANQIYYSGRPTSDGFLSGLKSFFGKDATAAGNVSQDLTQLGLSDKEAGYYDQEYRAGRSVVAVRTDGHEQKVLKIFQSHGAHSYNTQGAATTVDQRNTTNNYADTDETDASRRLRLREEQLSVDKQRVQAGEVTLHKEVITEQKNINVPVTHEEVFIERHAVTGPGDTTTPIGQSETIRVPVNEEQVTVTKNTVTTGEVEIGKRAVQENQRITDTVKREEARIERKGEVKLRNNDDLDPANNEESH